MKVHIFVEGQEVWRDIPGHEGSYQVSDHGRIRSLDRLITEKTGRVKKSRGRVLKPGPYESGHLSVVLGGGAGSKLVHAMVMLAFEGPYPVGLEILHLDHTPSNNRFINLKYGTRAENVQMDYDAERRKQARSVLATAPDGTVTRYKTITAAGKAHGIKQATLSIALRNGHLSRKTKVRFKYVDERSD